MATSSSPKTVSRSLSSNVRTYFSLLQSSYLPRNLETEESGTTSGLSPFGLLWVPLEFSQDGTDIHVQVNDKPQRARIYDQAFYDPEGKKLRE